MNSFFGFFGLGKSKNKKTTTQDVLASFPDINYEIEFLKALNKSPTDQLFGLNTYWEGRYTELLGNLTPIIENFITSDFLEVSLKEESLTVNELKAILKENSISTSGNKEVLAKRVHFEVANKDYLSGLQSFYKLTSIGREKISEYEDDFEKRLVSFSLRQAELFERGYIHEFEQNHFQLKNKKTDQRTLGGEFDSLSAKDIAILEHLKKKLGTRIKWNFENETQNKLRASLALRTVNYSTSLNFIGKYFEEIDSTEVQEFHRLTAPITFPDTQSLITAFLEFEYNYLWNLYTLAELLETPEKNRIRPSRILGVQIFNDGCECQEKFGIEKFIWKQEKKIPVLPRHLNCRCIYNGFFSE